MASPTEEDLRVAREAIEAELGKRGTTGLEAQIGRALDRLEVRFASALAAEREKAAKFCDAVADQASINETEFDSIGESCLIPNVKYWEGQRVAAEELAATIRAGDKE